MSTITSSSTVSVTLTDVPVVVASGVTINATPSIAIYGPMAGGTVWAVENNGLVVGSYGIALASLGSVTNNATGTITGNAGSGIGVDNGLGTVINSGVISGSGVGVYGNPTSGINFSAGGSVTNNATGVITATGSGTTVSYVGAFITGGAGTVTNLGSISGSTFGVQLTVGGSVTNGQGGPSSATIYGGADGIYSAGPGTIVNFGTLVGQKYYGAELDQGGSVTNGAKGSTSADIRGGKYGVVIGRGNTTATGSVTNFGTIETKTGYNAVELFNGGAVYNGVGAVISGADGVQIFLDKPGYASTVTNAGTITATNVAGNAVALGGASDRLIVEPSAVFVGYVNGGGGTMELASAASTGTITDLGAGKYGNFANVIVDSGATWTLAGNSNVETGATFTDLGTVSDTGTFGNAGTIVVTGGMMTIGGLGGVGNTTLQSNATLAVAGGVDSTEIIDFAGTDVRLTLGAPIDVAGTLTSFGPSQVIDLDGVNPSSVTYSAGYLNFALSSNPATTGHIALPGVAGVSAVTDGSDGALVTLCFLSGTLIRTPRGDIPVEKLAVDDEVLTWRGQRRPITWIGVGKVLATRGRRNAATPVIIRRHALADNVPSSDLRVTKGHSLFIDDVLIPVENLVNHRSIQWDDRAQEVSLYHIELDRHDVLIANGAPAESYRDDGNRWLFQNVNPNWDADELKPCAPIVTGGPIVTAAWRRILERSGPRPGLPLTEDADVHLLVDGKRVDRIGGTPDAPVFALPRRHHSVRIVSRADAPDQLGLAPDPRQLGVAVQKIVVSGHGRMQVIDADDERLSDGYHGYEPEPALRWTKGDAALPRDLFEGLSGRLHLQVHIAARTRYVDYGVAVSDAA